MTAVALEARRWPGGALPLLDLPAGGQAMPPGPHGQGYRSGTGGGASPVRRLNPCTVPLPLSRTSPRGVWGARLPPSGGEPERGQRPLSVRRRAPSATAVIALIVFLFAALGARAQTGVLGLNVGEGRVLQLERDVGQVLVGDASVADVQVIAPRTVYVYGRKPGQTTLSATDPTSGVAAQLTLRVTRSAAAAQAALPSGTGPVMLGFEGNRIVLRGSVAGLGPALDASATARAYNATGLPPLDRSRLAGAQQVTLRVRIAEVSRSTLNQLGVNLSVLARPGSFTFSLLTGNFLGAAGNAIGSITGIGGGSSTSFGSLGVGFANNRVNVDALVNALQSEGLMTMLAEPNLTALSGETASFLAGGEIPIPVPQSFGVTTIAYRSYGVQLAFTPVLLPEDRIGLRVQTEVSQPTSANAVSINGTSVPAFIARRAQTNVEMASGQTLAIAGLFQRADQNTLRRFPFLGDLPILGALFRSSSFQRDETELVILITPFLSGASERPGAFRTPLDAPGAPPGAPAAPIAAGFMVN